MRQLKLFRWAAVLIVSIALAPSAASAQEDGSLTISSTFSMDFLSGTIGSDLAEVYANGHEHTWTLTLHGTSQLHYYWDGLTTQIHATSFDLTFFGPDAATLNGIVSDHIAEGEVLIDLTNFYWGDFASIRVLVWSPDVDFQAGDFEQNRIRSSRPTRTATPSWGRTRSPSGRRSPTWATGGPGTTA